jgi:hypothetical protein
LDELGGFSGACKASWRRMHVPPTRTING